MDVIYKQACEYARARARRYRIDPDEAAGFAWIAFAEQALLGPVCHRIDSLLSSEARRQRKRREREGQFPPNYEPAGEYVRYGPRRSGDEPGLTPRERVHYRVQCQIWDECYALFAQPGYTPATEVEVDKLLAEIETEEPIKIKARFSQKRADFMNKAS